MPPLSAIVALLAAGCRSPGAASPASNSVVLAPLSPRTLRANSITAHCMPEADAEERHLVLARVPDRLDLALDAAVAEAAGDQDAVDAGEMRRGPVLLDLLRVDPPQSPRARRWRCRRASSASCELLYASGSSMYLPTTAIVTSSVPGS